MTLVTFAVSGVAAQPRLGQVQGETGPVLRELLNVLELLPGLWGPSPTWMSAYINLQEPQNTLQIS